MNVSSAGPRSQRRRGDEVEVSPDEFQRLYAKRYCDPVDDEAHALAAQVDAELVRAVEKPKRSPDAAALKKRKRAAKREAVDDEAEQRETAATTKKAG